MFPQFLTREEALVGLKMKERHPLPQKQVKLMLLDFEIEQLWLLRLV
jgi:hypothetical protein